MLPLFDDIKTAPPVPPLFDIGAAFNEFWSDYPRKTGKDAAQRKFNKVLTTTKEPMAVTFRKIMDGLGWQKYKPTWSKLVNGERVYCPHPATWLHQGRYNDPMPPGFRLPSYAAKKIAPVTPEQIQNLLELRAHVDHQNHLTSIERAEQYYREKPWVTRTPVPPCPCANCVKASQS